MPSPADASVPPFVLLRARARGPVVLLCEHAFRRLPPGVRAAPADRAPLADHWGWDPGAWALTRELSRRLDAPAIGGRWSRLWLDLNRHVADPTLVLREAGGVELSFNRDLDAAEIRHRVDTVHAPYHEAADRLVRAARLDGRRPLVLAVHSFTPVWDGRPRAFELGVLFDRHERAARALMRGLAAGGARVRANRPYSGRHGMMYAADRHGEHHRLVNLELEINQGLFREPGAAARWGATVADALAAIVGRLDRLREPR